jgi:hypothetical protein
MRQGPYSTVTFRDRPRIERVTHQEIIRALSEAESVSLEARTDTDPQEDQISKIKTQEPQWLTP